MDVVGRKEGDNKCGLERLVAPQEYRLPTELKETIRRYMEELDAEWMVRHPVCEQREQSDYDVERKWGVRCRACFSPTTWQELTADLERALALHTSFAGSNLPPRETALRDIEGPLALVGALRAGLQQAAAAAWPFLYHAREELATAAQALETLQPLLEAAAGDLGALPAAAASQEQLSLAWLLADLLHQAGLPCFVQTLPEGELLSPGIEILTACLELVGIRLSLRELAALAPSCRVKVVAETTCVAAHPGKGESR